jgi:hypothetical protein
MCLTGSAVRPARYFASWATLMLTSVPPTTAFPYSPDVRLPHPRFQPIDSQRTAVLYVMATARFEVGGATSQVAFVADPCPLSDG